jgi:16S rRNA processing protein RimM
MRDWVKVLALTTPHGVKGSLHTKLFVSSLDGYPNLLDEAGNLVKLTIVGGTADAPIVKIDGVNDRNEAERWRGKVLGVHRDTLPALTEADTYYIADLVGMQVVDAAGDALGTVHDVMNYGAGDILEIAFTDGKTELFAFTKLTFPTIDTAARRITFVRPDVLVGDS